MNYAKISNPLTIIAIFAGLTESLSVVALWQLEGVSQILFVAFMILFPSALVGTFFFILYKNPKVLYSPGDFRSDETFVHLLGDKAATWASRIADVMQSIDEIKKNIDEKKGITDQESDIVELKNKVSGLYDEIRRVGIFSEGMFGHPTVSSRMETEDLAKGVLTHTVERLNIEMKIKSALKHEKEGMSSNELTQRLGLNGKGTAFILALERLQKKKEIVIVDGKYRLNA